MSCCFVDVFDCVGCVVVAWQDFRVACGIFANFWVFCVDFRRFYCILVLFWGFLHFLWVFEVFGVGIIRNFCVFGLLVGVWIVVWVVFRFCVVCGLFGCGKFALFWWFVLRCFGVICWFVICGILCCLVSL